MKALERYLSQNKSKYWKDWILLEFHKWISDYGQNWVKPLMWLGFISFLASFIFQSDLYAEYFNTINNFFREEILPDLTYGDLWGNLKALLADLILFLTFLWHSFLLTIKTLAEITKIVRGEVHSQTPGMVALYFAYAVISAILIYHLVVSVKRKARR